VDSRARLLKKIFEQGFRTPDWRHNEPPPVVELEEFFEGNTSNGSIAPNLDNHPGVVFFYEKLKSIRGCPDVLKVLINIYDLTDIVLNVQDGWPGSECVHVLTSASEKEVQSWADELLSDGAMAQWPYGHPKVVADDPPKGFVWWTVTWD
jgi:hypothetical protein